MVSNVSDAELLMAFASLPNDFVVIDTETTDLIKGDDIPDMVTLGIAVVENGAVFEPIEYSCRPSRSIHPLAENVHGISDAVAASFPPLATHWPAIQALLNDQTVVMHNAEFDWTVLQYTAIKNQLLPPQPSALFCSQKNSIQWAHKVGVGGSRRGPSLDALTEYFGIEDHRQRLNGIHSAAHDAWQTACVVKRLIELSTR